MELELDSHGYLTMPNLHDGHLIALQLVGKSLRLTVTDASKHNFIIELVGIKRLRCNEFSEGNIIHHVVLTSLAKPPMTSLRKLLGEPHASIAESYREQHEVWVGSYEQSVVDGHLLFMELQPSYGCEVLALCESIKVDKLPSLDGERTPITTAKRSPGDNT